jgi:hypothetical protein
MYTHIFEQLKPGGTVLIEGFSEKNLGLGSGGPQDLSMLFTEAKIKSLLSGFQNIRVWEECVELNEGMYHQGTGMGHSGYSRKIIYPIYFHYLRR